MSPQQNRPRRKNQGTARLEIVTHRSELPETITRHYGVPAAKAAETRFYTVFVLETHETGDNDSGSDLLTELQTQGEIVAHAWSRPIPIKGYTGPEFVEHLRERLSGQKGE